MNRSLLLALGAICWSMAVIDAGVRLFSGDVLVPAVMAIVFVVWTGLRLRTRRGNLGTEPATAAG